MVDVFITFLTLSRFNWIVDCMNICRQLFFKSVISLFFFLHYYFINIQRFLVCAASIQRLDVFICLSWLKKCLGLEGWTKKQLLSSLVNLMSIWDIFVFYRFTDKTFNHRNKAWLQPCFTCCWLCVLKVARRTVPFTFPSTERQLHPYRRDHPVSRTAAAVWEVPVLEQDLCSCAVHHGGQHGPHPALCWSGHLRWAFLEPGGEDPVWPLTLDILLWFGSIRSRRSLKLCRLQKKQQSTRTPILNRMPKFSDTKKQLQRGWWLIWIIFYSSLPAIMPGFIFFQVVHLS